MSGKMMKMKTKITLKQHGITVINLSNSGSLQRVTIYVATRLEQSRTERQVCRVTKTGFEGRGHWRDRPGDLDVAKPLGASGHG